MKKIAIIADDLTGASDCGAMLLPYAVEVDVLLDGKIKEIDSNQAVVINTDSRSLPASAAYSKLAEAAEGVALTAPDIIYKKIDSTMRGNVGQELDALYDVLKPDVILLAPGLPSQGRVVKGGIHYLHGIPLAETEAAKDPKTPVKHSDIKQLVSSQSKHQVQHLTVEEIRSGYEKRVEQLLTAVSAGAKIITADSEDDDDLRLLSEAAVATKLNVIYAGSAGLMEYLPTAHGLEQKVISPSLDLMEETVLLVVGSVSPVGRKQLNWLMESDHSVQFLEVDPVMLLQDNLADTNEWKIVIEEAQNAHAAGKHIVLFSSSEKPVAANEEEAIHNSNRIAQNLGEVAAAIVNRMKISRLFLTGGDTAIRVMEALQADSFHILGQVEAGVPIGQLNGTEIIAVTKAGSFGSQEVMGNALELLKGVDKVEANYRN